MGLAALWHLPGPGLEPMSPALAGGFPTTVPPRKSRQDKHFVFVILLNSHKNVTLVTTISLLSIKRLREVN